MAAAFEPPALGEGFDAITTVDNREVLQGELAKLELAGGGAGRDIASFPGRALGRGMGAPIAGAQRRPAVGAPWLLCV